MSRGLRLPISSLVILAAACATPGARVAPTPSPPASAPVGAPASAHAPALSAPMGPLRISVLRFAAVEAVLRDRYRHQAMPSDAQAAWSSLFAVLDAFVAGRIPARSDELLEAQRLIDGELWLDGNAYSAMPTGLDDAAHSRTGSLVLALRKRAAWQGFGALRWPLDHVEVTSPFGNRLDPVGGEEWRNHLGVDLDVAVGSPVRAAAAGEVVDAGDREGYGYVVSVAHGDGWVTRYAHLSEIDTAPGAWVEQGQVIGLSGETGRVTGPHLHFEVWREGQPLDPEELLEARNSVGPGATHE